MDLKHIKVQGFTLYSFDAIFKWDRAIVESITYGLTWLTPWQTLLCFYEDFCENKWVSLTNMQFTILIYNLWDLLFQFPEVVCRT